MSRKSRIVILAPHAAGTARRETLDGADVRRFRYLPARWEKLAYGGGIAENIQNNRWLYLAVPFFVSAQIWAIARLLRREPIDVVHAHWWLPQGLSAVLARYIAGRRSIPIVCTLHGADVFAFGRGAMGWLMARVLQRCKFVCPVSDAVRGVLPKRVSQVTKVRIAPMGVDLKSRFVPERGVSRDDCQVIFAGRLVTKKGVEWLIRAFAQTVAHPIGARMNLRIVGDGPLRRRCDALVAELGLVDRISFEGAVGHERLPRLFSEASIAVVPSLMTASGDREGLGLTAIEAQGCQCAVIVSDTPSLAGIVTDRKTGLVVPQGDVPALAAAILELARDSDLRCALAQAGRDAALIQFDWSVSSQRYEAIYEQAAVA